MLGLRNPALGQAVSSHSHVLPGEGMQTGTRASLLDRGRNRLKGGRSLSKNVWQVPSVNKCLSTYFMPDTILIAGLRLGLGLIFLLIHQ